MTKVEYIKKFGEAAYKEMLEKKKASNRKATKKWYLKNKEKHKKASKDWCKDHPTYKRDYHRHYDSMFAFVKENEKELIENYDKALKDNFNGWHIHHRKETDEFMSMNELKNKGLYYNRPASELIFLTNSEHTRIHNLARYRGNK